MLLDLIVSYYIWLDLLVSYYAMMMFWKFPATETGSHILCPTHDAMVDASIVTWDEAAQRRNSKKRWLRKERERESVSERESERDR